MVEVNPLVETNEGTGAVGAKLLLTLLVMCMDAKLNFDDNAEFRYVEITVDSDFV